MDQRERLNDFEEALRLQMRAALLETWCALPAIVQSFDPTKLVASAQPSLRISVPQPDGTTKLVDMPVLINLPVVFPSAGGYSLTFPVKPGDEGLVVFADRSIDNWWMAGGVQNQVEQRYHDLSDGFLILGPRSVPRVPANISTTDVVLRSDDGLTKIAVQPGGKVAILAPGGVTITGNLQVNGAITHTP